MTRFGQHIDVDGTFRQCLMRVKGVNVEDISDLQIWGFTLPSAYEFNTSDTLYREGVEYRVQKQLQSVSGRWKPYFQVISNVTAPVTTELSEVIAAEERIIKQLEMLYHERIA